MELQEELNSSGAESPLAPQVPSHLGTDHSHLGCQLSNGGFKPVLKSCIFFRVNCSNLFQWHLANFGHLVSHVFYEHLSNFLCCLLYMYVNCLYKDKVSQCIFSYFCVVLILSIFIIVSSVALLTVFIFFKQENKPSVYMHHSCLKIVVKIIITGF